MLWMKGWLETRWRLFFILAVILGAFAFRFVGARYGMGVSSTEDANRMIGAMTVLWLFAAVYLAGAGIRTQPSFQAAKGLHGSTYFTLSLPVSRSRLLAVRVAVGTIETMVVILLSSVVAWTLFPLVRGNSTLSDMLRILFTAFCCTAGLHAVAVVAGTFLDDMWQIWGTLIAAVSLKWLTVRFPLPPALDVFGAMSGHSPLINHMLPWGPIATSIGLFGGLVAVAAAIVNWREY